MFSMTSDRLWYLARHIEHARKVLEDSPDARR
jgi:hypothetical protein